MEALRDSIFHTLGTAEALIEEDDAGLVTSRQWRKPLSIMEVNQMAQTQDVRARAGRP